MRQVGFILEDGFQVMGLAALSAFEFANVKRLQGVGLGLIGIQMTALLLVFVAPQSIGQAPSDYKFDLGSWLGILVVFILAEVFRQGAAMRDEQLTTV